MAVWHHGRKQGEDGLGLGGARLGRGDFAGPGAEAHFPPDLGIEPEHLVIRVRPDIAAQSAALEVTTRVVANRGDVRALVLNGVSFQGLTVEGAGAAGALTHSYDGERITITWDRPFAKGERREVTTRYRVEHPVSGLFFMSPTKDDPDMATYAATDHETERARHWLACVDLPNVRTTLEFHITGAADHTILANGALVTERPNGDGTKTAHWRLEQRCPSYLVCFVVGDLVKFDDGALDGIPVAAYACRDFTAADLERAFGRTKEMLAWMQKRLGVRFPYPKYYQFALPNFSGAMENISLVSWNDWFVVTKAAEKERTWITDQVNLHEMAHSYFGDLVVCRDFAHAWLKESWATYMESCWLEENRTREETGYDRYKCAEWYFNEADKSYKRPIVTRRFESSWQMYDRHLYPGGAMRIHTLRHELGDACFWPAVTEYLTTYAGQVVETDDFRRILERHSGRSLQKLFDQWFMTAAYPDLKVTFSFDQEKKTGTFEIEQRQCDEAKGIPAFELQSDLGWTIDGKAHTQPVRLFQARHAFTVAMDKDPQVVRFDPLGRALHKLDFDSGDTRLKAQLTGAEDVVGRILAAKQLCAKGSRGNIRAVLEAYDKETFWGVRREMAKALADSQTEEALAGLARIVGTEKDHLVLDYAIGSAGDYRDVRIRDALLARIEKRDLPPDALATAYHALGRQRDPSVMPVLTAGAKVADRQDGIVQAAAFGAMGNLRTGAAAQPLLDASRPGRTPFRARGGPVMGLGRLAQFVEKPLRAAIEERLTDLLRDPDASMRKLGARALGMARVKAAVPALTGYRATLSRQEQVVVDGIIKQLGADEDSRVAPLEKRIDELLEKYRKLHDRLQTLEDRAR